MKYYLKKEERNFTNFVNREGERGKINVPNRVGEVIIIIFLALLYSKTVK